MEVITRKREKYLTTNNTPIINLRYADDTILIATSPKHYKIMPRRVYEASAKSSCENQHQENQVRNYRQRTNTQP